MKKFNEHENIEHLEYISAEIRMIDNNVCTEIGHKGFINNNIIAYGHARHYESSLGNGEISHFDLIIKDQLKLTLTFLNHSELLAFCEKHNFPVYKA